MITALFFIVGLICLVLGAHLLVRSSSTLAVHFGIPAIVIGVTVVAFATSAPEIAVSIGATISERSGLALGNVLGSNIANILLILGASAIISPMKIQRSIVRQEVPIMIFAGLIIFVLALDGGLQPVDGIILLSLFILFMIFQIFQARKERRAAVVEQEHLVQDRSLGIQFLWLVLGLGLLVLGARWLVTSAVDIARFWGMSELVIGLTIIALGTSLPEVATSIIAALNDESDLSVGNVVGSNIFNILLVLGVSSFFSYDGVTVSSAALALDIPLMIAVSVACLPIFFTGYRIRRWEGILFLCYYIAYLVYLFLNSTQHALLPLFNDVMLLFVIPITLLTLFILAFRYWQSSDL